MFTFWFSTGKPKQENNLYVTVNIYLTNMLSISISHISKGKCDLYLNAYISTSIWCLWLWNQKDNGVKAFIDSSGGWFPHNGTVSPVPIQMIIAEIVSLGKITTTVLENECSPISENVKWQEKNISTWSDVN